MSNLTRAACLGTLLALTGLATAAANAPAAYCSTRDYGLLSYGSSYKCGAYGRTLVCPCKQFGANDTVSVNCPSGANADVTQFANGDLFKYPKGDGAAWVYSDLGMKCSDGGTWKGTVTKNGDGSSTIVYSIQK